MPSEDEFLAAVRRHAEVVHWFMWTVHRMGAPSPRPQRSFEQVMCDQRAISAVAEVQTRAMADTPARVTDDVAAIQALTVPPRLDEVELMVAWLGTTEENEAEPIPGHWAQGEDDGWAELEAIPVGADKLALRIEREAENEGAAPAKKVDDVWLMIWPAERVRRVALKILRLSYKLHLAVVLDDGNPGPSESDGVGS